MNDQIRSTNPPHTDTVVTVSRRLVPGILSIVLFSIFVAFMIGYFLGVKYTTDEFVTQIRQETFADQLLAGSAVAESASAPEKNPLSEVTPPEQQIESPSAIQSERTQEQTVTPYEASVSSASGDQPQAQSPMRYGAELIGFGTKAAAEDFIKRVTRYSPMALELKERQSKTARGKVIKWYQVVTGKYEQKQELQKLLDSLIKKEHLHDIKIVAYAPNTKDLA